MYVCVYRNIFFALYSWGILQVSFDITIIFLPSQAVFKILMQPDSRQCLPMVWYKQVNCNGCRPAARLALSRRSSFRFFLKKLYTGEARRRRRPPARKPSAAQRPSTTCSQFFLLFIRMEFLKDKYKTDTKNKKKNNSLFFLKHLEKPRGDNCIQKPYFFLSFVRRTNEEFCMLPI